MTPDVEYAMGMAQVLATLAVAAAVIARRTSTRPLQSAQTLLHFALGAFGLLVLWDVLLASGVTLKLLSDWLRRLNLLATGALLLLMYALAPFFQTKAEKRLEAEALRINRMRGGSGAGSSLTAGETGEQTPPRTARTVGPKGGAAQGRAGSARASVKIEDAKHE